MGVDRQDGGEPVLTYEQRVEYVRRLAEFILAYPDRFSPASIKTARAVALTEHQPLADASFDWVNFRSSLADNAVAVADSVADVGRGVQTGLSTLRWGIPLLFCAVIGAAVWAVFRKAKKVSA